MTPFEPLLLIRQYKFKDRHHQAIWSRALVYYRIIEPFDLTLGKFMGIFSHFIPLAGAAAAPVFFAKAPTGITFAVSSFWRPSAALPYTTKSI